MKMIELKYEKLYQLYKIYCEKLIFFDIKIEFQNYKHILHLSRSFYYMYKNEIHRYKKLYIYSIYSNFAKST